MDDNILKPSHGNKRFPADVETVPPLMYRSQKNSCETLERPPPLNSLVMNR